MCIRAIEVIIHVKHPFPTIDDILVSVKGSISFSKLGLNSRFHQLKSSIASHSITILQTEKRKNVTKHLFLGHILSRRNYIMFPREFFQT